MAKKRIRSFARRKVLNRPKAGVKALAAQRKFYVKDIVNDGDNCVRVRNEETQLSFFPDPQEMTLLVPSNPGDPLQDVIEIASGTRAKLVSTHLDDSNEEDVAIITSDPVRLEPNDYGPDLISVDEYYDDNGSKVFVLEDSDGVIGVRG